MSKTSQALLKRECKHAQHHTTTQTTKRMFFLPFAVVPFFSKGLLRLLLSTSLTKPCGRELCGAPRPCDDMNRKMGVCLFSS
jgi:hypothetical protein